VVVWRHGQIDVQAVAARGHADAHAAGIAHHHAIADTTVLPAGPDAAAEATVFAALSAVPASRSTDALAPTPAALRHVWVAASHWAATTRSVIPARRPPRA
jgi:hypothetical protein